MPWDVGLCTEAHTQWYFNIQRNICETFVWGGCGGNRKSFETFAHCRKYCPKDPWLHTVQVRNSADEECDPFEYRALGGS